MTRAIDPTQAIVLSGGGAYGAYEVGVMKALFTGECRTTGYDYLNPGVFAGTSVGAYNAAFMVSRPDEDICASIRLLESAWVNQIAASSKSCGNGVFRIRFDPGFGVLGFASTPVLSAIGSTVAIGAFLSLLFAAILTAGAGPGLFTAKAQRRKGNAKECK